LPTRLKSNNQVLLAGNLQEALQLPESGISANQVHLPLWKCQLPMQGNLCSSPFDTDSMTIGIDKWCSACILHCIEDFIDVLRPCHQTISSFAGSKVTNIQQGTILCQWEDDIGKVHEHTIPNSYYVPQGGLRFPTLDASKLKVPRLLHYLLQPHYSQVRQLQFMVHMIPAMWPPSQWHLTTPASSPSAQWQS